MDLAAQDDEVLAYHEAGHAVVGWSLKRPSLSMALHGIDGVCNFRPRDTASYQWGDAEARVDAQILLGGEAAERAWRELYDSPVEIYGSIHDMVELADITAALYPDADEAQFAAEWVKEVFKLSETAIQTHFDKLELLARALHARRSLNAAEIANILGPLGA